jgi:amino acid adenylation domain-containing protein
MGEELLRQQTIQSSCFHPSGQWVEFAKSNITKSIAELFEAQAEKSPDRLAVKTTQAQLTYSELNAIANQLARTILAASHGEAVTVALCLVDTPLIVAILAALKAGQCQVLLDPSALPGRTLDIVEDAQVRIILANQQSLAVARSYANEARIILNVDDIDPHSSTDNLGISILPEAIVRIVYTSGSTGRPKGVMNTQQGLLHSMMKVSNVDHLCAADKLLFQSKTGFIHMLRTLLIGGTIYPFDMNQQSFATMVKWLKQEEITVLYTIPTVLRHVVEMLDEETQFPHLRLITLGGEALYREQLKLFTRHFSEAIFMSLLGSREVSYYRVYLVDAETPLDYERVPAGYSFPDFEVLLLDEDENAVAEGQVGEIVVKSSYLSAGYWQNPELTAARFFEDPEGSMKRLYFTGDLGQLMPDGLLMWKGRKDFQVKIRGFRVELDQVTQVLLTLPDVKEAAVVAHEDQSGALRLVAYISCRHENPTASALQRQLVSILPDYMIPSTFVILDTLPLTSMGKINRQALPPPSSVRPLLDSPFVTPRTPAEAKIASIWADVLGVDEIGVHDSFLDLGGHSLQASQIVTRVLDAFQVDLPLRILFEKATVASMADLLIQNQLKWISADEAEMLFAALETMPDAELKKNT